MFDARIRPLIDPPLDRTGRRLAAAGITANHISLAGLVLALAAAGAIFAQSWGIAFALVMANRLCDGLDGAVARAVERLTDLGGFVDIMSDFVFYAAVPVAFILTDPADNAVAGALLLASFYLNGTAFLAFAAIAARRGLETRAQGRKTIYYLAGLAEGTETVVMFALMCLLPDAFAILAMAFAALCFVSAAARIVGGIQMLRE